jgi:hypothetical protein
LNSTVFLYKCDCLICEGMILWIFVVSVANRKWQRLIAMFSVTEPDFPFSFPLSILRMFHQRKMPCLHASGDRSRASARILDHVIAR